MALYRLPFPEEDSQTWFVNNGGWDQGGHAAGQGDAIPPTSRPTPSTLITRRAARSLPHAPEP